MAKFRGGLPRRGPLPFRYVFLLTFVFFIFSTVAGLWVVNKGIEPVLMAYAENETRRIATLVIKNAVNKQITEEELNVNEIINIQEDESGKIQGVYYNNNIINRISTLTTDKVEQYLRYVDKGNVNALEIPEVEIEVDENSRNAGFYFEVPLGAATNNALLGNLGPRVPIRFHMIGDVMPDIITNIKPAGINNMVIEISIVIDVTVQVIVPFATEEIQATGTFPIVTQIIQGDVPDYYNNGGGNSPPSIQLPKNRN
ncbi:sporulation protein YunB [Cytobacillus sp. S13-E01]|uniref:sporulation protein YunB n=1 Tax=Cytobacillus sp. S13-E01 TaxID=3031326 RepID=UPI0023D833CF|nr:sporulation protein YunB [Cytobacillus sp. S13-E01]MDF0727446.1 sporulation protein YunB [Cytobacillus sp. S13-E01]